jgi:anti-anti-sigma factor
MLETPQGNAPAPRPYRVPSAIDSATADDLKIRLQDTLRVHGPSLVLDLEAVEFIDSTGLGMLLSLLKEAHDAGGNVRLLHPSRAVLRLLQITGLERVFEIEGI